MLTRWMRQVKKVRPWMVAVALAAGAPLAVSACGDDDSPPSWYGPDVPTDVSETTEGTTWDDGATDCTPPDLYGPAPCTDDDQCIAEHGAGWACTGYSTFPDGCGGTITWGPMCEEIGAADADADGDDYATYYGPPPADGDADGDDYATFYGPPPADAAGDDSPAGWYGPPPTDAGDVPGNYYGPTPADV